MAAKKNSVLFICLGNICRSTMAEAIFLRMIEQQGKTDQWEVDSAALGTWNIGKGPNKRTMQVLNEKKIDNYKHKARKLTEADYTHYDVIFGMDDANMDELEARKPSNSTARLERLGAYDPLKQTTIRDPFFDSPGDLSGFNDVYTQCERCCAAFLEQSEQQKC